MPRQAGAWRISVHRSLCLQAVWAGWGHASENPKLPELLCKHEIAFLGSVCPLTDAWGLGGAGSRVSSSGCSSRWRSLGFLVKGRGGRPGVSGPGYGSRTRCLGYCNGVMLWPAMPSASVSVGVKVPAKLVRGSHFSEGLISGLLFSRPKPLTCC